MEPRIEVLTEKKLVGKHLSMTLASNRTAELWRSFMPKRKEIKSSITTDLISMQVYAPSLNFKDFNAHTEFEKWAAIEVADFNSIPDEMETYTLTSGLYAVFLYRGASSAFAEIYNYIFGTWLPNSNYILDHRPHFELLGEKYKNDDPNSEEEIWIPIMTKE